MSGHAPADVQLRDVTADDLPIFFAHQLDPVATRMAAFPSRGHDAFMDRWTRTLADETCTARAILADGLVAGNIVSWAQEGERWVGYWLGREYWGRGIATAALAAFLRLEPARPLHAHVVKDNVGSLRVLEKCGFVVCGEEQGDPGADGVVVTEVTLRLDADA